jgi:hypothetical protein
VKLGTSFVLFGVARNPEGRIGLMREDRIKTEGGSRVVARAWTGDTWPNTSKGARAAAAETGRLNADEAVRLGLTTREAIR